MSLYSVTIHRKVIVTKYLDKKGKQTETYEEMVEQTFHDLPYVTCLGYKKLDPQAIISQQATPVQIKDTFKGKFTVSGKSTSERYGAPKAKPVEKSEAPVQKQKGYADVVNAMMKDVA